MNVIERLVEKLPSEYTMILLPLLIILTVFYILPRIRKDKNGKFYFYSESFENNKQSNKLNNINKHLTDINSKLDSVQMENLKQSLFLESLPVVERLYAGLKYVKNGGNGQCKQYLQSIISENQSVYNTIIAMHPQLII